MISAIYDRRSIRKLNIAIVNCMDGSSPLSTEELQKLLNGAER